MRRLNGWLHGMLGVVIGTCLVAGCLPAPNRAKLPGAVGAEGVVRSASQPGMGNAVNISSRVPGAPNVMSPPLQAPSVISNNGGNILKGSVRAPASIISHNGGNIISNNGGGIVSNNGGGIISHNGGNLQIAQLPLAFTTVRVKDAAGQPVKDEQGRELVAKTDAAGNYAFPVEVTGRNLVIEADVDGQNGKLKSLLPKEGVKAGGSLDVDMTSTLTLAYILDQYVKGDLNTFERLPKDIEAKARVVTEEAIVEKQIALPTTLDDGAIVAKVDEVRKAEPKVDQVFEEIKRLLVVAGIINEGDGLKSTQVDCGVVGGATTDAAGNIYVFSQSLHSFWKISPDGILHTLVPKGGWGYQEGTNSVLTPGYVSGLIRDSDGSLILADTFHHRVVRIDPSKQVTVLAGTGLPGFSGDGGDAKAAQLNRPSGIAMDAAGSILVSDTENHRVRKITRDGKIQTVVGDGTAGFTGDGGPAKAARVNRPQGLVIDGENELYIADYENSRVRVIAKDGEIQSMASDGPPIHSPISLADNEGAGVLCLGHMTGVIHRLTRTSSETLYSQSTPVGDYQGSLVFPRVLVVQSGRKLVDTGLSVFGALNDDGTFTRLLGSWTQEFAATNKEVTQFVHAFKMAIDRNENIYVTDMGAKRIFKVHNDGRIEAIVGNGAKASQLTTNHPTQVGIGMVAGIAVSNDGSLLFTTIGSFTALWQYVIGGTLTVIAGTGKPNYVTAPFGPAGQVDLPNSYDLVLRRDGSIAFSVPEHNYLLSRTREGVVEHMVKSEQLGAPDCLAVDSLGDLTFVEENNGYISRLSAGMPVPWLRESDLGGNMPVGQIRGIAYDSADNLYVAGANRVIRYGRDQQVKAVAGIGAPHLSGSTRDQGIDEIKDIEISPKGDLYILEAQQLKRVPAAELQKL